MIEQVRVSERARVQLINIKRRTGVQNWNIICRWALAVSLKDKNKPAFENIPADSSIEMTWRTFGGTYEKIYMGLLIQRLIEDKIEITKENVNLYFKIHLHRGISYLTSGKFKKLKDYLNIQNN
mgnify:FL=1